MNKIKLKLGFIILIICLFVQKGKSQTDLIVHYNDGTETLFSIFEDGKFYTNETDLFIETTITSPVLIPKNSIRKIVFADNQISVLPLNNVRENKYFIYPNPAQNSISIGNMFSEKVNVQFYSVSGQLLLQKEISEAENIDISCLTSGLYFVKINGLTLKFSKL
ncbi:MAG: T9SS type A sorting domain-containing protein [Bacteroidales bacterium]|jgi:hypothetical protein|nr:T9SS type A sorting domain-containing protein [Bacteroidales bacterium]